MKVSLLIWNPQNRALLSDLLRGLCEVVPPEEDRFSPDVDLIIVDGPALATSSADLTRAKRAAEPLFLPVLLIASRPDVMRTLPGVWEIVDEVITRPLLKREFQARIASLLRARRLSLRLRESKIMYEREHVIAESFQHAALPSALPEVRGFAFDAFYEPAGDQSQIGGDWYDAVCLSDGRIVLSIGDVAGAGLHAAVTMAYVREAIRAVAQIYANPVTMLDAADRTLKDEQPGTIVTAFAGVIDPVAMTMTYASAGHPPPLMRCADGSVRELRAQSLPLGLRGRDDAQSAVVDIFPGCMLCFYTDGLSEVSRDLFEAEQRMRSALAAEEILTCERPAHRIKESVYDGQAHRDDVAILTVSVSDVREEEGVFRWTFDSRDAESASSARRNIVRMLGELGAGSEALFTSELIFGELLGNVVRYAPGEAEIVLDVRSSRAVLHVMDRGDGFTLVPRLPSDLLSERGRGLFLVWTLSDEFNVDVREAGGSHARVLLPVEITKYRASFSRRPSPFHADPKAV